MRYAALWIPPSHFLLSEALSRAISILKIIEKIEVVHGTSFRCFTFRQTCLCAPSPAKVEGDRRPNADICFIGLVVHTEVCRLPQASVLLAMAHPPSSHQMLNSYCSKFFEGVNIVGILLKPTVTLFVQEMTCKDDDAQCDWET